MNDPTLILAFLGWCTLINIALLTLTTGLIVLCRGFVTRIHAGLFGVKSDELDEVYFRFLAYYKLAIILFNLTPYLALRIIID